MFAGLLMPRKFIVCTIPFQFDPDEDTISVLEESSTAITVTDDEELAMAVGITNNCGALGPPCSDVADVGNIHGFVASLLATSSASANSSLVSETAPEAAVASTSTSAAATAPPLVARATASVSASLFAPPSSSTPRATDPRQRAPPRRPVSSTFVQPTEATITPVASTATLTASTSARDEYFCVKARELEMSIAILAVQKKKEEEMLKIDLEERKLLVKQRQMKLILMQATLRVQLLKEEKLKLEIRDSKAGGKETTTETFGGLGEEEDTFYSVDDN
jgi:hypothetical protein